MGLELHQWFYQETSLASGHAQKFNWPPPGLDRLCAVPGALLKDQTTHSAGPFLADHFCGQNH